MAKLQIELKRAYEPSSSDDGLRILVERLWPRGLKKADAAIDHWPKNVAPTPALRTWFGHRPERWDAFKRRYRAELSDNKEAVVDLLDIMAGQRRVTFVFAAKDEARNGAVVLRAYLMSKL